MYCRSGILITPCEVHEFQRLVTTHCVAEIYCSNLQEETTDLQFLEFTNSVT